jgi:hypothetical protein
MEPWPNGSLLYRRPPRFCPEGRRLELCAVLVGAPSSGGGGGGRGRVHKPTATIFGSDEKRCGMSGWRLLLLCIVVVAGQTTLLRIGNFLSAYHWSPGQVPACLVPACDEEHNVNFVLPPLCCSLLPTGPFLSYDAPTAQLNFSVPAFLAGQRVCADSTVVCLSG